MSQHNNTGGVKMSTTAESIISLIILFAISLIVVVIFNNLIIFNIEVKGNFMEKTIMANNRAVGFKAAYKFGEPKCLDVIAFNQDGNIAVGRIIGLPEDTIKIINGKIYSSASNMPLDESNYLQEEMSINIKPFFIPKGQYFVMGDNRSYYDGLSEPRKDDFVSEEDIMGKLFGKIYPSIEFLK